MARPRNLALSAAGAAIALFAAAGIYFSQSDYRYFDNPAPDTRDSQYPLFPPRTVGQSFLAERSELSAVGVKLSAYTADKPTGQIILELYRGRGDTEPLRRAVFPATLAGKYETAVFRFNPIPDSALENYYFRLAYPDGPAERAVGVSFAVPAWESHKDYPHGEADIGGDIGGDIAFSLYYAERPLLAWVMLGILCIGGLFLAAAPLLPPFSRARSFAPFLLVGLSALFALLFAIKNPGGFFAAPGDLASAMAPYLWRVLALLPAKTGAFAFVFAHIAAAALGTYFLLKSSGRSLPASLLGASVFAFCGYFALRPAHGQLFAFAACLAPPAAYFFFVKRNHWLGACFSALAFLYADLTLMSGFILFIAVLALIFRGKFGPSKTRFLAPMLLAALAASLFAPVGNGFFSQSRDIPPTDATAPSLYQMLLDPNQSGIADKLPDQEGWWYEYGAFIGFIGAGFALLSLLFPKKAFPYLCAAAVFSAAVFSGTADFRLGNARLMPLAVFFISFLAAIGMDNVRALLLPEESGWQRYFFDGSLFAVAILAAGNILFVDAKTFDSAVIKPLSELPPAPVLAFSLTALIPYALVAFMAWKGYVSRLTK